MEDITQLKASKGEVSSSTSSVGSNFSNLSKHKKKAKKEEKEGEKREPLKFRRGWTNLDVGSKERKAKVL